MAGFAQVLGPGGVGEASLVVGDGDDAVRGAAAQLDRGFQGVVPGRVEHGVDALRSGGTNPFGETVAVNDGDGAEGAKVVVVGLGRRTDDSGAAGHGDLDADGADDAGGPVDQQRLTVGHLEEVQTLSWSSLDARRIVERLTPLGGRFEVDAVPDWGTTVTIDIPLTPPDTPRHDALTGLGTRELQVLGRLACGRRNRDIAQELHISESTVKFHVAKIFDKLGVSSRGEAAALAQEWGAA